MLKDKVQHAERRIRARLIKPNLCEKLNCAAGPSAVDLNIRRERISSPFHAVLREAAIQERSADASVRVFRAVLRETRSDTRGRRRPRSFLESALLGGTRRYATRFTRGGAIDRPKAHDYHHLAATRRTATRPNVELRS